MKTTALALPLIAAAGCAGTTPPVAEIRAALFAPTLRGDVGLNTTTVTDVNTIDLDSALDLGGRDRVPHLAGELQLGRVNFAANHFALAQDGEGTVTANFGSISAGSTVASELDLGLAHGQVTYALCRNDWWELGVGLAADYVDFDLEATELAFGLQERVEISQPVPLAAARLVLRIPDVPAELLVDVAGIGGKYGDIDGAFWDASAVLRADVAGPLSLFAGYRYVQLDISGVVDRQAFDGEVALSGFLAGLALRF